MIAALAVPRTTGLTTVILGTVLAAHDARRMKGMLTATAD